MEIKRDYYLQKLIDRKNNHLIKIITGIRRCGKSYLLNHLFKNYLLDNGVSSNHIIMIALDDDGNSDLLDSKNLRKYIDDKILDDDLYYILLDEIQMVTNFEGLLNGLLRKKIWIFMLLEVILSFYLLILLLNLEVGEMKLESIHYLLKNFILVMTVVKKRLG